jgi:PAS domain S-box-containing protein
MRFFTSAGWTTPAAQLPLYQAQVALYWQRWQVEVQALPAFVKQLRLRSPAAVAAYGCAASTLSALLLNAAPAGRMRERQLQRERANMAAVVETSHDAIATHDSQGRIVSWNPAAGRMLGWQAHEVIGRDFFALLPPAPNRAQARELRAQIEAGHGVPPFEAPVLDAAGTEVPVEISVSVIKDMAGRITGCAATMHDRREQLAAQRRILELNATLEQQVRQRTAELRALLDSAGSAIVATDLAGRITLFNPAAERMFRLPAAQALGRPVASFHDPEEVKANGHLIPHVLRDLGRGLPEAVQHAIGHSATPASAQPGQHTEWTYLRADGTRFVGLLSMSLLHLEPDTPVGFMGVVTDLTERKALEEQLRERSRQAQAATEAKSAFLAHMSHEIRTPLNAVIGLSQLLAQTSLDERQRMFVTHVNAAADQLLALVNDILDLSKIEAGEMRLESTPFELPALLQQARAFVELQAAQKNLELVFELAPGLPQRLIGDPTRLKQILINLLGNAVKFTGAGGSVTLRLQQLNRDDARVTLRLDVIDTGVGIPREKQTEIFEPFTQADVSTTRRYGGTGLGLSIVRRLVEMIGGRLELRSEPGQGSTFSVTLTLALAPS